ncbi:SMP-30/gluconolactonase/LRE family protein [Ornithinicoccus halotolerans]|uniref:SMP-30/gluconolactonase/LRE family protein n=1 Tax=Ornithinicoccus halotolerans TaxID=1748220 RepID=UPI0018860443|nr:SMP-30/gluconolactonase/LRE family protein [Ornithinicoccus halotolerans]
MAATQRIPAEWEGEPPKSAHFLDVVYEEGHWLEGPAYSPLWRSLLFSDIPADRVLRLDEATGTVGVWRSPAGFANGRTLLPDGRVVSCEHGTRSVSRMEQDGTRTVLADHWHGRRLNSPNDVAVRHDGSIWFTDPSFGILSSYEGHAAPSELDGNHVYRIDPDGHLHQVTEDMGTPNGLAFSPDGSLLYVADTVRQHIRVFEVTDGALRGGEVFAETERGSYDGLRVDEHGGLWAAALDDGVHYYGPDGSLRARLALPLRCSNLTFGGLRGNQLYLTATTTLFRVGLGVRGLWAAGTR